jgi:hypothetical protein
LPVVDGLVPEYADSVRSIAVAGRAGYEETAARADELLTNLEWGLDESVWDLYGVRGQPVSLLITGNDVVVDMWFGALDQDEIRTRLDRLVGYGV